MPKLDPNESLGFHCNLTLKSFISALQEQLKGTGVSPTQHRALAHLISLGPLSQSELVDYLAITPASGVRLIDRMERDGWVIRKPDYSDGRKKRIYPTPKAFSTWEEISVAGREVLEQAYKNIQSSDIEIVKLILGKVRKNLEA